MTTVFINGRFFEQPLSGVQRYSREIVARLDDLAGEGQLSDDYCVVTSKACGDLPLKHIRHLRSGSLKGHAWEQFDYLRASRKGVALSLAMSGPVLHPRHLCVVHDAAIYRHPEHFGGTYVRVHATIEKLLAKRATIGTVSHFSKDELSQFLHVPPERFVVATNGSEHLDMTPDEGAVARLGLTDAPFFLMIGNLTRNKNIVLAVKAIERLVPNAKLVIVGRMDARVFASSVPEAGDRVVLAGRLDDAEVAGLMRHARALVFPSIYEGFGIPPLEAMYHHCPVLASTAPAVVEVCADAADYFEPHDDAKLAELMLRAIEDDGSWRADRIRRGQERVARYSWRDSALVLARACSAIGRGQSPTAQG